MAASACLSVSLFVALGLHARLACLLFLSISVQFMHTPIPNTAKRSGLNPDRVSTTPIQFYLIVKAHAMT